MKVLQKVLQNIKVLQYLLQYFQSIAKYCNILRFCNKYCKTAKSQNIAILCNTIGTTPGSEGKIKTHSTYGAFISFHRLVMLVLVSGTLAKSPNICNVASRKTCFRIDVKEAYLPKPKSKPMHLFTSIISIFCNSILFTLLIFYQNSHSCLQCTVC